MSLRGKILIIIAVLAVSLAILASTGNAGKGGAKTEEIMQLTRDIQALNLIDRLYLNKDQTKALIAKMNEAKEAEDKLKAAVEEKEPRYLAVLTAIKQELVKDGKTSKETEEKFNRVKDDVEKLSDGFKDKMSALADDTQKIFNENQIVRIAEFKPCIIQPHDVKDPERIGQSSTSGIEKMLGKIREVPEDKYAQIKDKHLAKVKEKLAKHMEGSELDAKLAEISRTIDEARSMSKEEFELKKTDIAKKIALPEPKALEGKELKRRIAVYFLNPNLIPVLQERLDKAGK